MKSSEKSELALKLLDGDISPGELEVLQHQLLNDAEMLAIYQDHVVLELLMQNQMAFALSPRTRMKARGRGRGQKVWALAACLVAFVGAAVFFRVSDSESVVQLRFAENSSFSIAGSDAAEVLKIGEELELYHGAVELQLPSGVSALVMGPARFRLQDEQALQLSQGRVSVSVPKRGRGFRVVTPRFTAVDLGTEFVVSAGWGGEDELHVVKGEVAVGNGPASEGGEIFRSGEAVSVDERGAQASIEFDGSHFCAELPASVRVVLEDDFEIGQEAEGSIRQGNLPGWFAYEVAKNSLGVFNPKGDGRWYSLYSLNDNGESGGVGREMKGPRLGFILSDEPVTIEKKVERIQEGQVYTATITLGVRDTNRVQFSGYEIAFISEGVVLESQKSLSPPGEPNEFVRISFSWDVGTLPQGVQIGDMMGIRITALGEGDEGIRGYLDFDRLEVSALRIR